jgi:aryl-alcohol dehydrogenase-like predicted oxidoreductase
MKYRTLGKSGIEVSALCFGCWGIAGGLDWGDQDEKDAVDAMRAAHEEGVTFFDSAEAYGDGSSERLVGKALASVRDDVVIATKVSPRHFAPAELEEACDRSLRNLGIERIGLYQLHWWTYDQPMEETVGVLNRLAEKGKIRAYGVSNFGRDDLTTLAALPHRVQSNQVAYSLILRAIEFEIQPLCMEHDISVLTYSSLAQGLLTGRFATPEDVPPGRARTRHFSADRPHTRHGGPGAEKETFEAIGEIRTIAEELGETMANVSLAWLMTRPGVGSVIAGARNPDQARENARAADLELAPDVQERLAKATDPLKQILGLNADPWQSDPRVH